VRLDSIPTPYSLGTFYENVTSALGFRPDRHAGKIVGLAAYGDPEVLGDVLQGLIEWQGHRPRWRRSSDVYLSRRLAAEFAKIDVAAAYQTVLEEIVVRYVSHYVRETGLKHVALAGGVAANVKLNQRVHEIAGVEGVYIHPNMGDGGCGTGAAMIMAQEHGDTIEPMASVYLGPEYSPRELQAALTQAGFAITLHDDIEIKIARLLADNRVVARFDGRMEYGPRALGNRSILYPATDPEVNQWLNHRLHRTEFMPFAPVTLAEDARHCYEHLNGAELAARFMTITFDCTPWMREHSPAAVHVDGTARPQLVTEETNASLYRILHEYKQLTGLPSVINTSFNMHEEPIVCSPRDAVRSFLAGGIDYLAMGDYLVPSPRLNERVNARRNAAAA
jgi:carbamoyltransferase